MGEKIMHGFPSREEALADFFAAWEPPAEATELVSLDEAVGRVTARDLMSANTLPVVRASACDGIAVRSAAFADGRPDTSAWELGRDYVRADTGDDFPDAYDAVIMIEKAAIQPDGSVVLDDDVQVGPGTNVRQAGDTIRAGAPLMKAGLPIRPTDLAALAMGGITLVPVRRKPRIAFIPTGSELVPAGIAPRRGQNVDTNSLMVKHMLIEYGAEPLIFPIVHDDEAALERAFAEALAVADRIGVMNKGKIEQIAAPQNLYQRPATEYVATFIGLTNRLPGASNGDEAVVFGQRVPLLAGSAKGDSVAVLVRPENLTLALAGSSDSHVGERARVEVIHFLGSLVRVDTVITSGEYQRWNKGEQLKATVQLPASELPAGLAVGDDVIVTPRPVAALAC